MGMMSTGGCTPPCSGVATPSTLGRLRPNGRKSGGETQSAITLQREYSSLIIPLCVNHQDLWLLSGCTGKQFGVRVHCGSGTLPICERPLCVWTHTWASNFLCDLTAVISHQTVLQPFLLPLDTLMAQNWPCHYDHINFKLAPNDAEIMFKMTRTWLPLCTPPTTTPHRHLPWQPGEKSSFTLQCQNKIRIKTLGDNGGLPERKGRKQKRMAERRFWWNRGKILNLPKLDYLFCFLFDKIKLSPGVLLELFLF